MKKLYVLVMILGFAGCASIREYYQYAKDEWKKPLDPGIEQPVSPPAEPNVPVPPPVQEAAWPFTISRTYGGLNVSNARLDTRYTLSVTPNGRDWSPAPPSDWRMQPGLFNAVCVAFYQLPDGTWAGGKYEWLPTPPRPRGWGNILNGYNGWVAPPRGTRLKLAVVESNGQRRSTIVDVTF
jgi:hypothetical protein